MARVAGLLGVQPDGAALDAAVRASSFEAMRQRHEATDGAASRAMRHEGEAGHFLPDHVLSARHRRVE